MVTKKDSPLRPCIRTNRCLDPRCHLNYRSPNNGIRSLFPYTFTFETLPLSELDTLCTIDQYPSDSFIFPAYGCELQISDGLVAAAFASLPQPGQSILILHCVLELTDGEIGAVVGMSRSAVQRHRTKALNELRKRLEEERRKPK